jgi:acetyl esterase/lipase
MEDDLVGVALPKRWIPFPTSISAEARAALERAVGQNGVPHNAAYAMPHEEDREAWLTLKISADKQYARSVEALAGTLRSSTKTVDFEGATIHVATPDGEFPAERAYIDFHGGGLVFGGGDACRIGAQLQADQHRVTCYGVDYRTPPDFPYPVGLDDSFAAYRYVLSRHAPQNIIVGGRSAGGNLAAALMLKARDERLPLSGGLILLSPQIDLSESGDSFQINQLVDVALPSSLMSNNQLYAAGQSLTDPYLSPLFGNLERFPPTFLQSGTRDLFLSNTVRMHRALRSAGVEAELHVFEAMPHGGFGGRTPEDRELTTEVLRFATSCWISASSQSPNCAVLD